MDKIKILLIDDSPFCGSEEPLNQLGKDQLGKFLGIDTSEVDEIEEFGFPVFNINMSGKYKYFMEHFELKWLYSTSSIKTYFDTINSFEDNLGSKMLGKYGYVPDIVVFDYALTGNERNQPKGYRYKIVKEKLDPTLTLLNKLNELNIPSKTSSSNYDWEINKRNDDRFGLFAGGIIVERFRHETPCFGLPATYWETIKLERTEPGFFEWLLADAFRNVFTNPDLKGKTEDKKSWDIIINAALPEYRKSIIELVCLGKIQIDLKNFLEISNEDFQTFDDLENNYFIFDTAYGKRTISLNGLFTDRSLDEINTENLQDTHLPLDRKFTERSLEVWQFLKNISEALISASKVGISISDIEIAINNSNNLLQSFDSLLFKKRLLLSHYHKKVIQHGFDKLDEQEKKAYQDYYEIFKITDEEKLAFPEYSISTIGSKGKRSNKTINRLTTFFVATKLWERYSYFISTYKDESNENNFNEGYFEIAIAPPNTTDLLLALFPIWPGHAILFNENGTLLKAPLEAMGKSKLETLCDFVYSDFKDDGGVDLRELMTPGEYMIVRAFASSLKFKMIPYWLKHYSND